MLSGGKGFEMTVNASEPDEQDLVQQCVEDLWDAVEEGRLRLETPRGSVGQTDLHNLQIDYNPSRLRQPWKTVGMWFDLRLEDGELSRIASDLQQNKLTLVAYGDKHVWELSEIWYLEGTVDIMSGGENPVQSQSVEFMSVAEIDWRWP